MISSVAPDVLLVEFSFSSAALCSWVREKES